MSTLTSAPSVRSAAGREADTSASPPVLLHGVHSEVANRTLGPFGLIRDALQKSRRAGVRAGWTVCVPDLKKLQAACSLSQGSVGITAARPRLPAVRRVASFLL